MNLQELSSPIRLYWDIGPSAGVSSEDCRRICGEIVENKLLSLQVTETGPALGDPACAVLDELQGKPLAFSLVIEPAHLNDAALAVITRSSVKVLYLVARTTAALPAVVGSSVRIAGRPETGVSFPVSRGNYLQLPDLLAWCVENRIKFLQLPMQRLTAGEECFFLTAAEQREMTGKLQRVPRPAWLTVTIHDPFLWKTFFPDREFPGGGCQAANTMLYIAPTADVYPCPVVPIKIGSLLETPLREIIRSDAKKATRKRLLEIAARCQGCAELTGCKGGCRGRAYALAGTMDHSDPSCA